MARLRSALTADAAPSKTRQALKEKTNTTRVAASAPVYANDGNTEDLVKIGNSRRGRPNRVLQDEDELVMTGGLGNAESPPDNTPGSDRLTTANELAQSVALPSQTTRTMRRTPRIPRNNMQTKAQSKVMEGLQLQMAATAREEATKAVNVALPDPTVPISPGPVRTRTSASGLELSEFSLSPSPPPLGKLSAIKGGRSSLIFPGSVLRPHRTPAADVSTLALKHFKRRPRQPSMLQMVQQHAAKTKTSTLHAKVSEAPTVYDMESGNEEDEVEDDFAPDAEGTPVHPEQVKRKSAARLSTSARKPEKRNCDSIESSSIRLDASMAKRQRRIADEINDKPGDEISLEESILRSSTEAGAWSPLPRSAFDVQVINSASSTPQTEPSSPGLRRGSAESNIAIPSTEDQYNNDQRVSLRGSPGQHDEHTFTPPSATMAEPASSSPIPYPAETMKPTTKVVGSSLKSEPKKRHKPNPKPLSSAALQSLLPKRRRPRTTVAKHSEFDLSDSDDTAPLDPSHLSDHEDELNGRLGGRQRKSNAVHSRKSTAAHPEARKSKVPPARRKTTVVPAQRATMASKKALKTYGRRAAAASDKENDDYDSTNEAEGDTSVELPELSMYEATKSKELEEMKRKFAEIDALDMDFETIDDGEHRSSSLQWR